MLDPAKGYSCKGNFHGNKANGYCKVKYTDPAGVLHRWEGGVRNNLWHGLGIYTASATGERYYALYEGTEALKAQPIFLSPEQAAAIKNGTLNYKTLFRDPGSVQGLTETPVPFQAPYDVDQAIEAIYRQAKSLPQDFDV